MRNFKSLYRTHFTISSLRKLNVTALSIICFMMLAPLKSKASSCQNFFDINPNHLEDYYGVSNKLQFSTDLNTSQLETNTPQNVLIQALRIISQAQNNSTVYIVTPQWNLDNVGYLFLYTFISQTSRNVKLKVLIQQPNTSSDMLEMLAASSDIQVQILFDSPTTLANEYTFIVAQTHNGLESLAFEGGIQKSNFKNTSTLERIKSTLNMLGNFKTAPFKKSLNSSFNLINTNHMDVAQRVQTMESAVVRGKPITNEGFSSEDLHVKYNTRAYELAVQLVQEQSKLKDAENPLRSTNEALQFLFSY